MVVDVDHGQAKKEGKDIDDAFDENSPEDCAFRDILQPPEIVRPNNLPHSWKSVIHHIANHHRREEVSQRDILLDRVKEILPSPSAEEVTDE